VKGNNIRTLFKLKSLGRIEGIINATANQLKHPTNYAICRYWKSYRLLRIFFIVLLDCLE